MSTACLVFFGTPFRGSEGLRQIVMARRGDGSAETIPLQGLDLLKPGNEILRDMISQFTRTRKARVACFYELRTSNVGKHETVR